MIVYHEVRPSSVEDILRDGLRRTSHGEKGQDELIVRTDKLLDELSPEHYRDRGLSRDNNIYAYVVDNGSIIDITDGSRITIEAFMAKSNAAILQLEVDAERCYVSDLDRYDALKHAVHEQEEGLVTRRLAGEYWSSVVPLSAFAMGAIKRPEVMITYDVPAHEIRRVS